MYKNFCAEPLGVNGRQSELIELALTYGFKGLEIDITEFAERFERQGSDYARRYIDSAGIRVGTFELPVRWQGAEAEYKEDLARLPQVAEAAASVQGDCCFTIVEPASDERPFNENFEFCRERIAEMADILAPHNIQLGLGFLAAAQHREGREFQFVHQSETLLTLIKTISSSNVGLMLDLWNWRVGGGGMDQLKELSANQIVNVRLADVPDDVDLTKITDDQRLLPGESESSDAIATLSLLIEMEYAGPIAVFPDPSCFSGETRDGIVRKVSRGLDDLLKSARAGETEADPATDAADPATPDSDSVPVSADA